MSTGVIDKLNRTVANLHLLYVKLHNYHWNVKGEQFFNIHRVTEEYYNYVAEQYDELAERILQLGGKPFSTVKEYLEHASIRDEVKTHFTAREVLEGLENDFRQLLGDFQEISRLAGEAGDVPTANIADENIQWLEKVLWMIAASRG